MFSFAQQNTIEPMQVDVPAEDNDNTEEEPYVVENPTLVCFLNNFNRLFLVTLIF